MYNNFNRGSEAYFIMDDGIAASQTHDEARDSFEEVIERACGTIDELEGNLEEVETERDDLEKELDEYKAKYTDLHAASSELIDLLSQTLLVGEKLADFSRNRLATLGALNETQDPDSGPGNSGDDSGKNSSVPADGQTDS